MLGDPKVCRERALDCSRRAQSSAAPISRDRFADLARKWSMLADELELEQRGSRRSICALTPASGCERNSEAAANWGSRSRCSGDL
jgi:hypothetical protein